MKKGIRHGDGVYFYQDRSRVEGDWLNGFLMVRGQKHPMIDQVIYDFKRIS